MKGFACFLKRKLKIQQGKAESNELHNLSHHGGVRGNKSVREEQEAAHWPTNQPTNQLLPHLQSPGPAQADQGPMGGEDPDLARRARQHVEVSEQGPSAGAPCSKKGTE